MLNNTQFSVLSSTYYIQSLIIKQLSELIKNTFKDTNILFNPLFAMTLHKNTWEKWQVKNLKFLHLWMLRPVFRDVTSCTLVDTCQGSPETESIYQTIQHHILEDFNAKASRQKRSWTKIKIILANFSCKHKKLPFYMWTAMVSAHTRNKIYPTEAIWWGGN